MGLTKEEQAEALSIEVLLRQGYDIQFEQMTLCDLTKHYQYMWGDGRYQVHNDTTDIEINEVLEEPNVAAECFVLAKRNIK